MIKFKVWHLFMMLLISSLFTFIQSQQNSAATDFSLIKYEAQTGAWNSGNVETSGDNFYNAWQYVQTPVTSQITDIFFLDSLKGWASINSMGAIRTTDSGFNWLTTSFNDTNFTTGFNGIYFVNANTGWSVGGALQIRKTTDGGATWTRQIPPPVAGILHSVYFIDANTGFAAGSKSYPYIPFIAKTTNGGTNWIEISPSFSGAQELRDQYWFNANTGWIAGYDVLLYTTNGGTNFSNLFANVPPSGNGHISLLSITFINQQTGWMGAATLERRNVYKTTNSGLNWVFIDNAISQGNMNQINDVLFVNNDSGWAVHGTPFSGAIMFTSNSGVNWTIEEQSVNWFDCLANFQNKKIWCGSSSGKVWYTTSILAVSGNNNQVPSAFELSQNYPNPFNPVTHFSFTVPKQGLITVRIYNSLGMEVKTPVNADLKPGVYEIEFDAAGLSSGVYYYRLTAEGFTDTKKMILVK